jgi:hypothetical protein
MQGLWSRGVFQNILDTFLTPEDEFFSNCFHYKIKRKGGQFDNCKVWPSESLCKVNPSNAKALKVSAIMTTLSVKYLLQAVFVQFSVLLLNLTHLLMMSISPRSSHKVTFYQEKVTIDLYAFLLHRDMKRTLDTLFIISSSHFTECRQPPERGTVRRWALCLNAKAAKLLVSKRTFGGEWSLTVTAQCLMHTSTILLTACANCRDLLFPKAFSGGIWGHIRKPSRTLPCTYKSPLELYLWCEITHLWHPTLAFQNTNATPTTNGDTDTCRSYTGDSIMMNGRPITWKSL